MQDSPASPTGFTLGFAFVALLAAASLWILLPFLAAVIWAASIVIATWPALLALQRRLGGRRGLAAVVMTLALVLVFVLPLALGITVIATHLDTMSAWLDSAGSMVLGGPPAWLARVPLLGEKAGAVWDELTRGGLDPLKPYVGQAFRWTAGHVGGVGGALVQILLTVVIAAILYLHGDAAATGVRLFARRLAGERGDRAVVLAGQTIRGVALGVVLTAVAQSLLGGIGLAVTGVPLAAPLTIVMFILCVAQLGPVLVLVPAIVWMYAAGHAGSATVLLVFTLVATTMDNVVRPMLIRKGADLPLLLIFAGVIGGLLSLGLLGIFIGPVVLAVTYRLLQEWVRDAPAPPVVPGS
jgi:predicted PurR-regulated permease PerM